MTVSANVSRVSFAGDDVSTSFALGATFIFFDDSDLVVEVVNDTTGAVTTLTLDTNYTVSGGGGATGTVDTSGGSSPHGVLVSGTTLVIRRALPITQTDDFVNGEISDAEVIEDRFDRLTMIAQQLDEEVGRALRASVVETAIDDLPTPTARRNKFLKFDNTASAAPEAVGVSELGTGLVLDEDDFASNSTDDAPSQQSTKTYVDAQDAIIEARLDTVEAWVATSVETVTDADSPKTITTDDAGKLFRVDASGDAVTLVLPAEATAEDGWSCQVYSVDTTNTITVEDDSNTAQWEMDVAGQMIQPVTDGTSWYNARPGAILNRQLFTSGTTHNFKKGTKTGRVRGRGAGGSGASARSSSGSNNGIAGGGGQGGFFEAFLDLDGISSTTITIGAGGAAPDNGNDGNDGGNTQWADGTHTLTGNGGEKGISDNNLSNGNAAEGGDGGAASGGDRNVKGSPGEAGISVAEGVSSFPFAKSGNGGGEGGGSGRTGSGTSGTVSVGRDADANSGAGGSGALVVSINSTGSDESGGAGADGYIHLEEMA